MKRARRGWLISAVVLALAGVALTHLVPDWRVRLGLERPEAPVPEAVAQADGTVTPAADAPAEPAPDTAATAEKAADGAAAPATDVATDTQAEPSETEIIPSDAEIAAVPEAAADGAAPADAGEAETEPAAAAMPAIGTDAETVTAEDAAPVVALADDTTPVFDVVRVDPEGEAVIAGSAQPGAEVELLIDGVVIASAIAGGDGSFVVLASLGRSDRARALQLRAAGAAAASAVDHEAVEVVTTSPEAASDGKQAGTAEGEVAAAADAGTADDQAKATLTAEPARAGLSAPVVILPSETGSDAPLIVAPEAESVALLQPAATESARVVLDRISYSQGGDAVAAGRARPGHAVRAYANAEFVTDAAVSATGDWQLTLPRAVAETAKLLRFDEVSASGEVTSRLETPFSYDNGSGAVETRQRRIVVQRGDNLWRIAEQHYGEGIRYSVIFGANSGLIRDPDLIYPGQVFSIPELIAAD